VYREWGWKMFQAIEKHCRTEFGYGAHPDVRDPGRTPDDRMESFFMAETLKYLYMLQSPDHEISLDKYVFNTEAHPLAHWE
jgi:mannosyl-oligosaccharide alpha-1,2-mannosidase